MLVFVSLCVNSSIDSGRSYQSSSGLLSVYKCVFTRFDVFLDSGGVIRVDMNGDLDISDCSFYNCSTGGYTCGAISFSGLRCNVSRVCGSKCSGGFHQFGNFHSNSHEIRIDSLSLNRCSDRGTGYNTFSITRSRCIVTNTNSSSNFNDIVSGISMDQPISIKVVLCCFSNCVSKSYITVYFAGGTSNNVTYSNIVNNTDMMASKGVVYVETTGIGTLTECVFFNNSNTLFCIGYGNMRVYNCIISHGSILTYGTVSFHNNSHPFSSTYEIKLFSSFLCDADLQDSSVFVTHSLSSPNNIFLTILIMFF